MAEPEREGLGPGQAGKRLMDAYEARARSDAGELDRLGFLRAGSAFPDVLLVKGAPGPAEAAGGGLLSGPDGPALAAALARLGYADDAWAAVSAFVRTPGDGGAPQADGWAEAAPEDLAFAVEALDPELAIALDGEAARGLERAWGLEAPLAEGAVARVRGRRVLALGGFEAALADIGSKRTMWARLKQVPPLGSPL